MTTVPGAPEHTHLAGRTASAGTWTAVGIAGQRGLSLLSTIVLARLLLPGAYGLFGMAMVFMAAANSLRDLGTGSALIQRKEFSPDLASTIFWVNGLFGLCGAAILSALAPLAARLYRDPAVIPVLVVLSVSFFLGNLSAVHQAVLMRGLAFRQIALIQLGASLVSTVLAICLAFGGAGVWSLVISLVLESAIMTALFWMITPWRPTRHFDYAELRGVTSYSINLVGSRALTYVISNLDKALIGRYLGAVALGYYSLAHGLMMYPVYNIAWTVNRVVFPAFSQIQDDDERFRRAYLRILAATAALGFPLMLGMLVTADVLVLACFGAAWLPMVPVLMILAPAGLVQSASTTTTIVFTAKGRTSLLFRLVLAEAGLSVLGYVVGLRWGVIGVATGCAVVHVLWGFPRFVYASRLIGLPVAEVFRAMWPPLRDAAVMCAAVLVARVALASIGVAAPWLRLGVMTIAGVAVYTLLVLWTRPSFVREVLQLMPLGHLAWVRRLAAPSRG